MEKHGRRTMQRALVTAAVGVIGSSALVAVTASPASAEKTIHHGCIGFADEQNPYTDVEELDNCDYVQARTYTYIGGGNTTTTYGSQGYAYSIAYKASGGTYSGGAARLRWNGDWGVWEEI